MMKERVAKLLMWLLTRFGSKNIIVFESFFGKQYSDSPKAIYEYLKTHQDEYKYQLIWSVKEGFEDQFKENEIEYVRRGSLRWIILMARSSYWINNTRQPSWIIKGKGTKYIQTWHGTPLKKLGLDIEKVTMHGADTESYRLNFIKDTEKWDSLIAQNNYAAKVFKTAFNIPEEKLIVSGYPRNDYLLNYTEDEAANIKRKLGIIEGKKVILYAPTWKDNKSLSKGAYEAFLPMNLEEMFAELSDDYVLLIKWHYLIANEVEIPEKYKDFAFKVPQTIDINQYFIISDMLITDYSSVFFDYANLKRKIIFYTPDWEEYENDVRGMYPEISRSLPGEQVSDTAELINAIKTEDTLNIDFVNKYCSYDDGHATQRIVEQKITNKI
ncbi:MAG TPA: CDP-glycerol glycerophosphotransferase family protein [Brochothrix thermosphacta]|nr:hypothetical protein BFR37_00315 [Brochothrix thermosphacta]HCZ39366.1 CDP-glycerol glycerophosphotransferase family protein [Brochothrix thermosphacta]HCZ45717.1 CDP-glycerol glycerophosphotransferase family protein [Brochothrix thermosphacta]